MAPSVFIIETLGADGTVIAIGSGVAVTPNQVVTNKHVVDGAISISVKKGKKTWAAQVTHLDPNHDLCRLTAEGLNAPPVSLRVSSTLQVGERVYTIGAPQGLELTFSEGLISALREYEEGRIIQTSAAISLGSSGGGLFDERGKLVGITTFLVKEGQNLNFALPSEWVTALEKHAVMSRSEGPYDNPQYQALAWFILGYEYSKAGNSERAIQAYREGIRLKPDDAKAWSNLGLVYSTSGQQSQAMVAYHEAIRLDPDLAMAWDGLGFCYYKFGQYDRAIHAYREAIRLKPDYFAAWFFLGLTYGELGQDSQSLEAYREATRLNPDEPELWEGLGRAYSKLRQHDQAIRAYREAIRLDPDFVRAWLNLGAAYSKQGNRAKVMEVYERLKLLDTDKADEFFNKVVLP